MPFAGATHAIAAMCLFPVDGLFTALQDYNRHTADRRVNVLTKVRLFAELLSCSSVDAAGPAAGNLAHRSILQVKVARDGAPFTDVSWEDVQVGDIVKA